MKWRAGSNTKDLQCEYYRMMFIMMAERMITEYTQVSRHFVFLVVDLSSLMFDAGDGVGLGFASNSTIKAIAAFTWRLVMQMSYFSNLDFIVRFLVYYRDEGKRG